MTLPTGGSSSSSSSLEDRCDFRELIRGTDEAYQRYSDATCKVSQLERYLNAVRVAIEASEWETTAAQMAAADAQARIVGMEASSSCCPVCRSPPLILLSS
jgi:DNA repair exonuclease SbcCD ATPase subunit